MTNPRTINFFQSSWKSNTADTAPSPISSITFDIQGKTTVVTQPHTFNQSFQNHHLPPQQRITVFEVVVAAAAAVVWGWRRVLRCAVRRCCMSVEYYCGGVFYGELANPLQWPQLRKKRRQIISVTTPLLLIPPQFPLLGPTPLPIPSETDPPSPPSFPPSTPSPILLPKPPPPPKVSQS